MRLVLKTAARTEMWEAARHYEDSRKGLGRVDTSQRLQHSIAFSDSATPTSRAKPAGVMGCEIMVKIGGPAPVDPSECTFLAFALRSLYFALRPSYFVVLRWVSKGGDKGPWSETVSATIGG